MILLVCLIITVVIGTLLLSASLVANYLLYKAGERHMARAEYLEQYVIYAKEHILHTYAYMKQLDDREIFSKDDEVGVSFLEILETLQKLNEIIQEEEEEKE